MLRDVAEENLRSRSHVNGSSSVQVEHIRRFLRRMAMMYSLENYTAIFRMLNITEEDIDYVQNFTYGNESSESSNVACYCSGAIREFALSYRKYHGYVALIVCVFGTVANVLNVIVLMQKDMVKTPINRILTGLACADMLVMLEYIPFAVYKYFILPKQQVFPYGWAVFVLFHMHFTQLFHTISIALTLTLAVWRYIAIRFPQYNRSRRTAARFNFALWSSVLAPFIACVPNYLIFGIKRQIIVENGREEILYHVDVDYSADKGFLYQLNFWILGVVVKLLPCVILTVISCWLIKALYKAKNRKQALRNYNLKAMGGARTAKTATTAGTSTLKRTSATDAATLASTTKSGKPFSKDATRKNRLNGRTTGTGAHCQRASTGSKKSERRTDRTTRMLVAVLLLFLVTEIPQGILGLLSGVLGDCFFRNCYNNFGEVMDILALLNGAINFILYCFMSRQFRTSFGQLFRQRIMKKWQASTQQTDMQSTYV